MMAIERHDLSQLYPGIASDKSNHRTSIPLSFASFGTSGAPRGAVFGCALVYIQQVGMYLPKQLSVRFEA